MIEDTELNPLMDSMTELYKANNLGLLLYPRSHLDLDTALIGLLGFRKRRKEAKALNGFKASPLCV